MENYHALIQELLDHGTPKEDRTGTGTWSLFGRQLRYHLAEGFPLLTTKKVHFKSVAHELLWFLRGDTNARSLNDVGVTIWDEWADPQGNLGPVYGAQWRRWRAAQGEIDQLAAILNEIKANPDSRRLVVSTWNVGELPQMALYPCHVLFQLYVAQGALSLHMYQRSADAFLGLPFNIASYALLAHMIAQECGLAVGDLILSLGDVHLYRNHEQQARQLLQRDHRPLPLLELDPSVKSVFAFQYEHLHLRNYVPHPPLPAPVAV